MNDYSKFLKEAYEKYILSLGGKKVPTPYRINLPFQPDRRKYGKPDPQTLLVNTTEAAKNQNFDLKKASVEGIRNFMRQNMLGVDCSGFPFHLLDYLLKNIGKGGMQDAGFPEASKTNVEILTSEKFTVKIPSFKEAQPGDLVRLDSNSPDGLQHCLIILEIEDGSILYAHSSSKTQVRGVHKNYILYGRLPYDLRPFKYEPESSKDGIYRLKALS